MQEGGKRINSDELTPVNDEEESGQHLCSLKYEGYIQVHNYAIPT
ncbi:hypothetical protein ykris0001_30230 [Yersinia kristensenii ATCC 33638]|nr:hypothetical protein ykris0001_30230 [Yersinia kristensenii ATCC 33638]